MMMMMMMMVMVKMKWLCKRKKTGYMVNFGPILTILAAENGETEK